MLGESPTAGKMFAAILTESQSEDPGQSIQVVSVFVHVTLTFRRGKAQDEQTTQHGEPRAGETHSGQDECKTKIGLATSFCFHLLHFNAANQFSCVVKGQKWSSDILTKQSKPSLAKSSSKLFFVSRLRGKKYKIGGSTKVLQDTSNTLDTSQTSTQGPQKVCSTGFLSFL